MRILPCNVDGVIVEVDDLDHALALFESLRAEPIDGVTELVPAARTVFLGFDPTATSAALVARAVRSRPVEASRSSSGPVVSVPVHYDGEDLREVARLCALSVEEVVGRHSAVTYSVAFTGFAPGFAYLSGVDPRLRVPRRSTPRPAIPDGAVAIAGEFTGIYPRASPGGWQLLGRTGTAMWDLSREPAALLQPGMRVEFVAERERVDVRGPGAGHASRMRPPEGLSDQPSPRTGGSALEIVATGVQALFQDLGRSGKASLGVSPSGAMDRGALRRANRAVGNRSNAPVVETALGGLVVRSVGRVVAAVTGAPATLTVRSRHDLRTPAPDAPFALDDGDELTLGVPARGVYSYLAVRGSFEVAPVLGSASRDVLAGLGPTPLASGDLVAVRAPDPGTVTSAVAAWAEPSPALPAVDDVTVLDVALGPRTDWCSPDALEVLTHQQWVVTPQSNRVGLRLMGDQAIARSVTDELPSEATTAGALQIPPSGQPVLFMADHPLTGGYPVIGCVVPSSLDLAAQVPIGGRIAFRVVAGFAEVAPASDSSSAAPPRGAPVTSPATPENPL